MEGNVKVSLASRWAELYYFEDLSTGPSSDVEKATEAVANMVTKYTMGDMVSVFPTSNGLLNELPEGIQAEIHSTVSNLYDDMCEFMGDHKDQVEAVADLLHEFGTVDGHDIHELIAGMEAASL